MKAKLKYIAGILLASAALTSTAILLLEVGETFGRTACLLGVP